VADRSPLAASYRRYRTFAAGEVDFSLLTTERGQTMSWTRVSSVTEYAVDERTVTFQCDLDAEEPRLSDKPWTVPVTLEFYDPRTFRFEIQTNPEARARQPSLEHGDRINYPRLDPDAISAPVDLTVTETEGDLSIETGVLTVVVTLDDWSFRVENPDGAVIFAEEREAVDVRGNRRVSPLGFETEEINHGPHRVAETGTAFKLRPDEKLYGLGEQFTGFDRRGREFDLWHAEPLGTDTERAYKNIPFHLSTNGYGLLVDTTNRVHYDLGASSMGSGTIAVDDDRFSCVFFYGPEFTDVIERYTGLTGRPDRPPKWSFGLWMSRLGYESRDQLEEITDRLRDEDIPADVVHLDPFWMRDGHACDLVWDREQFPDPEGMIDGLHDNDFRLSLWEHPHVPTGTEAFKTGVANGYFVDTGSGKPYVMDRTCQGEYRGALVDFSDPDAVEWWRDKHRDLLEMGVDTFKTDYGEYVPADGVFDNGRSGQSMHNLYPLLYNKAVYETVAEANGDDEALVWARSAWIGSQRFPVHWGGDPHPSQSGMAAALRGGLSASLSGIPFWSHDIGGFRGTPSPELYVRWAQFGLLSSHARCHGTTPREPWAFGERATDLFRRYANLRYRLLPYIYTYAEIAARTGLPVVRPLVLEYQDDPSTQELETQYLLGEDLLVAPVFFETGKRSIYLPEGEWLDFWTRERYEGEQTVHRDVDLQTAPLFLRCGSVLPQREPTQSVKSGTPDELRLRATLADGSATGRYYDEDADRLVTVDVTVEGGTLSVDLPEITAGRVVVEVTGVAVDVVEVNSETARHTDDQPAAGEWTDHGEDVVVVA
jgi:alpha-D-xyloside xylohydrolase